MTEPTNLPHGHPDRPYSTDPETGQRLVCLGLLPDGHRFRWVKDASASSRTAPCDHLSTRPVWIDPKPEPTVTVAVADVLKALQHPVGDIWHTYNSPIDAARARLVDAARKAQVES